MKTLLRTLVNLIGWRRQPSVEEQYLDAERGDIMVVRIPPDDTLHEIECPELGEEETESLRQELGRLFDLGDDGADARPADERGAGPGDGNVIPQ